MNNFIYIKQPDYSTKIYRIFSTNRLIELFEKKENALVKPELWDDPFENFILKIPEKGSKSKPNKRGYGQCWTLNFESDAMWRIYSPDKNGVRIQTTIRKLHHSLHSAQKVYSYFMLHRTPAPSAGRLSGTSRN